MAYVMTRMIRSPICPQVQRRMHISSNLFAIIHHLHRHPIHPVHLGTSALVDLAMGQMEIRMLVALVVCLPSGLPFLLEYPVDLGNGRMILGILEVAPLIRKTPDNHRARLILPIIPTKIIGN